MRSGTDDQLQLMSSGRGTYIMTASTGIQVAVEKEGDQYGVFTKQLIEGIQGDEADADGDGYITTDELYGYVRRRIREEGAQEPMRWNLNSTGGELAISRSGRIPWMERRNRIRDRVLTLAQQGALPNSLVLKALEVINLPLDQLTGELQRYDVLLDQLIRADVRVGDFIDQWYRASLTTPSTAAQRQDQSPVTEDRREEARGQYYIGARHGGIGVVIMLLMIFTAIVVVIGLWEYFVGSLDQFLGKEDIAALQVAMNPQLGTILADGNGMTLYMSSTDQPTQSACYNACAETWPPVTVSFNPSVGEQVDMTLIGDTWRTTGENQLTYNGHPLYYYAGDEAAGDVQGHLVKDNGGLWTAVTPAGGPVNTVPTE
jgi:predicted lipoprotein with Yx(FWY)xxD motif